MKKTNQDGTLDVTEIWDTDDYLEDILNNRGLFHIVIDLDDDKHFNVSRDVVDYHDRYGFRVSNVGATNASGNYTVHFTIGEKVYASGFGQM